MKAPSGATPEDQLLVQFQGMIAEYERAQIAERSRRGKRHRAQQGSVNVLSGAPYGYRSGKKSDTTAAYYEILESEATVVRWLYEAYTQQGLSMNAIAGMRNERQVPTRTGTTRWERSTVWAMLRNPAYRGRACCGKTEIRPRQRVTRPLRQRHGLASINSANSTLPEARSSRPCCRGCWFVSAAVRAVSHLDPDLRAPALLLPLPRFRCLASSHRSSWRQSPGTPGLS